MTGPLCRYCGKPIPKVTHCVWFGATTERRDRYSTHLAAPEPATKAEAQRLVNQRIVSVRRNSYGAGNGLINQVTTWDGESYRDQHFCNQAHAADFGRAAAAMMLDDGRPQIAMPAYWQAMEARDGAQA